ncbi:S9 family peptidase [Microbispora sp. KK1-11]|uniref:alpha/beta hydrolase family protein n=1 Tax=Microbispora sp. KK1-11 TaxID=2053005 RepID=UPI0011592C74|nr:alpha/beta fold hydrolase [Microbispora sp. KK1-11]TQS24542.1 alpha/beta fold hydrolase [Microbispora sp. KK1-11]
MTPETPATNAAVTFDSDGETLLGVLHSPAGPGPHPVVVLLHGFPGHERNFDLAQYLRRAGYAALVFHYRGSWGVGGSWSWAGALEDAALVAAAVREPGFAAAHRLDPDRLALMGHSFGGFAALTTAAADPGVSAVATVSAFDFGSVAVACREDAARRAAYVEAFGDDLLPLKGTSGAALVDEMIEAGEAWSLSALAPKLADRPVLLVGTAGRDTVTPAAEHHDPVAAAYTAHPVPRLEHRVLVTDHALSDQRLELAETVRDFLDRHLGR